MMMMVMAAGESQHRHTREDKSSNLLLEFHSLYSPGLKFHEHSKPEMPSSVETWAAPLASQPLLRLPRWRRRILPILVPLRLVPLRLVPLSLVTLRLLLLLPIPIVVMPILRLFHHHRRRRRR